MKRWIPVALASMVLAACGGENSTLPRRGDVHGMVLDLAGHPVGGVSVFVTGRPAVTTASDGSFTVADVPPIYDAALMSTLAPRSQSAIVYKGLTRRDPVLHHEVWIDHTKLAIVTGSVPPSPSETRVIFAGENSGRWYWADRKTGEFALGVGWVGSDTLRGKLHVLRWTAGPDSLPADFDGYAARELRLSDGDSVSTSFEASDLTDPAETTISGSVSIPSGYDLSGAWYGILFGTMDMKVGGQTSDSPSFVFRVPDVPELDFFVTAEAKAGDSPPSRLYTYTRRAGIAPGTTGLSIVLEAGPQLTVPADGTTGVTTSTPFLWSGGSRGIHVMKILPAGTSTFITVVLPGNTTRLPDFSAQGLPLPAGRECIWSVRRYPLVPSMDEAVTRRFNLFAGSTAAGDLAVAGSRVFRFTVAP